MSVNKCIAYALIIPRFSKVTINGKKIEIAVKQIVSGSTLKPSGTVANPESLKLYFKYKNIEEIAETDKVGVKSRL